MGTPKTNVLIKISNINETFFINYTLKTKNTMENTQRKKENMLPFTWSGWDIQDTLFLSFYEVEFTDSFGKINTGDKFSSISVDYSKGIIECYNEEGTEVVVTQNFQYISK